MSTGEAGQRWVRPSRQARWITPCLKAARSPASAPLPPATSPGPQTSASPPHTHTPLFKQDPLCPQWATGWGASPSSHLPLSQLEPAATGLEEGQGRTRSSKEAQGQLPLGVSDRRRRQEGHSGLAMCGTLKTFFSATCSNHFLLSPQLLLAWWLWREGHAKRVWPRLQRCAPSPG